MYKKIIKAIRALFIGILVFCLLLNGYNMIFLQKSIFDFQNILIIMLILSLLSEKKIFSLFLLMYSLLILLGIFFPDSFSESIYYKIFLGLDLSSFVRLNIINDHLLVSFLMNFSLFLSIYILFFEIPFRFYFKYKNIENSK
ncbi:MAG TPA: hypothetical protein DIT10_05935 [Chryseobacterium sp.]|nr:hypothetical protein [Chryseobacterium sp.]